MVAIQNLEISKEHENSFCLWKLRHLHDFLLAKHQTCPLPASNERLRDFQLVVKSGLDGIDYCDIQCPVVGFKRIGVIRKRKGIQISGQ